MTFRAGRIPAFMNVACKRASPCPTLRRNSSDRPFRPSLRGDIEIAARHPAANSRGVLSRRARPSFPVVRRDHGRSPPSDREGGARLPDIGAPSRFKWRHDRPSFPHAQFEKSQKRATRPLAKSNPVEAPTSLVRAICALPFATDFPRTFFTRAGSSANSNAQPKIPFSLPK